MNFVCNSSKCTTILKSLEIKAVIFAFTIPKITYYIILYPTLSNDYIKRKFNFKIGLPIFVCAILILLCIYLLRIHFD